MPRLLCKLSERRCRIIRQLWEETIVPRILDPKSRQAAAAKTYVGRDMPRTTITRAARQIADRCGVCATPIIATAIERHSVTLSKAAVKDQVSLRVRRTWPRRRGFIRAAL